MRSAFLWLGIVALVAGCSDATPQPPIPQLHPVAGVVTRNGTPVAGGVVQFTPEPDRPEFVTNSEVDADGRFTLATVRTTDSKGERKPGVASGTYRVTFMPPAKDQVTGGFVEPIVLPKTVTIDGPQSELKLELPAGR